METVSEVLSDATAKIASAPTRISTLITLEALRTSPAPNMGMNRIPMRSQACFQWSVPAGTNRRTPMRIIPLKNFVMACPNSFRSMAPRLSVFPGIRSEDPDGPSGGLQGLGIQPVSVQYQLSVSQLPTRQGEWACNSPVVQMSDDSYLSLT